MVAGAHRARGAGGGGGPARLSRGRARPLRREELVAIDPADALSSFTVDAALGQIDRFVVGDPVGSGVALAHWRLQQYLASDVLSVPEREAVRAALVAWCDRWPAHRARYALRHGAAHHLERAATSEDLAGVGRLLGEQDYQQARIELADDAPGLFGDLDAGSPGSRAGRMSRSPSWRGRSWRAAMRASAGCAPSWSSSRPAAARSRRRSGGSPCSGRRTLRGGGRRRHC